MSQAKEVRLQLDEVDSRAAAVEARLVVAAAREAEAEAQVRGCVFGGGCLVTDTPW